jgi:predicted O-linked N-acetylglucosamine transferase (SPINDLY family)
VSKNGFITFGSTNNPVKISQETLMLWCEILRALPDSRLLMTNLPGADLLQSLTERFAAQGIETQRLSFHIKEPDAGFRDLLSRIDIALDPFPYNGTTTTCEALWMGIPVVSLVGETSVARSGYALLKAVGLEELVARDPTDYVRIAVELARDPARLMALRTGLRGRMETSVLRDEAGFTRALETAYREMWAGWCETRTVRHA